MADQPKPFVRDYSFDMFRGLLMWCVPISHFTRVAGHFHLNTLSGFIYITINVFVMQGFMFLSGYFSKDTELRRNTAFHSLLWPYLVCIPVFYFVRLLINGHARIDLTVPPFALWYLFVLFICSFFLKNYIKIPHILEISLLVYLLAGQVSLFSDRFALGRMVSYFPFFLLGYWCRPEQLARIRKLKKVHCGVLALVLISASWILALCCKQLPAGFYLLKCPASELGIAWYWDILGRVISFTLACGWIVLWLNLLPNRKNFLAYVGMNTMPIYILHLIVRYLIKKHGIYFGVLPHSTVLYYVLIIGLASLCVVVFSSKPVVKGYTFVVEGTYKIFMKLLSWCTALLGLLHRPVSAAANGVMDLIDRDGRK